MPPLEVASLGDPISIFNGKQIQYWLPKDMTRVFSQGALEVYFQRGTQNRSDWVTKVEVRHSGALVATIDTVDPSSLLWPLFVEGDGRFTSMALNVNGSKVAAEGTWSLLGGVSVKAEASVKIAMGADNSIGSGSVDRVTIKSDGAELRVRTSKAHKMLTIQEQTLNMHLDIEWAHFDKDKCNGLLPEIWGLRPKSEMAKRMMMGPVDVVEAKMFEM